MSLWMRRMLGLLMAAAALAGGSARAHEMSMAEMQVRETRARRIHLAMDGEREARRR